MSTAVGTEQHVHVTLRALLETENWSSVGKCLDGRCPALAATARGKNIVKRLGQKRPEDWSAANSSMRIPDDANKEGAETLDDERRTFGFESSNNFPSVDFDCTQDNARQTTPLLGYLGFARRNDGKIPRRLQAVQVVSLTSKSTQFPSLSGFPRQRLIPITGLLPPESAAEMFAKDARLVEDLAETLAEDVSKHEKTLGQVVEWANAALPHAHHQGVVAILSKIASMSTSVDSGANQPPSDDESVRGILQGIVMRFEPLVAENLSATQRQFSDFILSENLRLNKLISNLYLKLALTDLPDEDLFGSVCHSVAEYFHCDAVSLFLRHQEEADPGSAGNGIDSTLRLCGAFGAWDRALKSPFVRRCEPIDYPLSPSLSAEDVGNTLLFYETLDPQSLPHRFAFRHGDGATRPGSEQAVPHQLAWLNRNLGTTCRNILGTSLRHSGDEFGPAHGVLRLENRRPRHVPVFRDTSRERMFFADLWQVLALRPYIRYLLKYQPGDNHLNNEVGWRRMYEELAADTALFTPLRERWHNDRGDSDKKTSLLQQLTSLKEKIGMLIGVVTTAESLFQHLEAAQSLDASAEASPTHCPSFFNLVNIDAAWRDLPHPDDSSAREDHANLRSALRNSLSTSLQSCISQRNRPAGESVLETLRGEFYNCLRWPGSPKTVDDLFTHCHVAASPSDEGLNLVMSQCFLLQILLHVCDELQQCGNDALTHRLPESVHDQYRGLLRCARAVQERLAPFEFGKPTGGLGYRLDKLQKRIENRRDGKVPFSNWLGGLIAEVLADATMYSHTFGPVDEARLLFISRRVVNLMSNRVVALGQSCDIPVNHNHVSSLCLDDYAIEKLYEIRDAVTRAGLLLKRSLEYWQLKHSSRVSCPTFLTNDLDLFEMIEVASSSGGRFELIHIASSKAICEIEPLRRELQRFKIRTEPAANGIWVRMDATDLGRGGEAARSRLQHAIRVEVDIPNGEAAKQPLWLLDLHRAADTLSDRLRMMLHSWERSHTPAESPLSPAGPLNTASSSAPAKNANRGTAGQRQPSTTRQESKLTELRRALDALIGFSSENAGLTDQEFLAKAGKPLKVLCREIGCLVHADTVAIFMEEQLDSERNMRMLAAVGALEKTLEEYSQRVVNGQTPPKGVVYEDLWEAIRDRVDDSLRPNGSPFDLNGHMQSEGWSLTNRIWHLGVGRIANSRTDMTFIRDDGGAAKKRGGQGDDIAYPPERPHSLLGEDPSNWTLKNVLRTFLGIPIFARGGHTDCPPKLQPTGDDDDALRQEFLLQHRVIGILKLEGKQPERDHQGQGPIALLSEQWWENTKQRFCSSRPNWRDMDFERASDELERLFRADKDDSGLGKELISGGKDCIDEEFVDYLTESLDARWIPEDVELLVSIAMEIGRLLTLRTLNYATQNAVFLTENDIGVLNVRHSDIRAVAAAHRAAEAVARKVRFELEFLRSDLTIERQRRWASGRLAGAVTHDPIRDISHRTKELRSLAARLVEHSTSRPINPTAHSKTSLPIDSAGKKFLFDAPVHTPLTAKRLKATAHWEIALQSDSESGSRHWWVEALSGSLQCVGRRLKPAIKPPDTLTTAKRRSLVDRILSRDEFGREDWAGVRVKCGFLSDIFLVVDAVRSRFAQRNVEINDLDIESWLEQSQSDGYRAVHFVVQVPLKGLISETDYKLIARALEQPEDGDSVRFPCEVQIRTEYESSWAWASHFLQYKTRQVRLDLQGYMGALSGLLYESDKIMDLIRQYLEAEDVQLVELLAELRRDSFEPAFAMVQFGVEFARHEHKDHRLYGGRPHFQRIIAILGRLVRDFHATDPYILLYGLLVDIWMGNQNPEEPDVRKALQARIQRVCNADGRGLLERLGCRLPTALSGFPESCDPYEQPVPTWFWPALEIRRDFARHGSEEDAQSRLDHLERTLEKEHAGNHETKRRCYILETAVQLGRLQELPHEPLRSRAVEELEKIYHVLEKIRREIGIDFRNVWRQAERELREAADRLDTHLPIDWQG